MSLKTFLFGEAKKIELKAEAFIGPDVDKLRADIGAMHKRATALVDKLETEIRRLGAEYEKAIFAAKGWALLVEHHAAQALDEDFPALDLTEHEDPEGKRAIEARTEAEPNAASVFAPLPVADPILDAGQEEAARLAREALANLPKGRVSKG